MVTQLQILFSALMALKTNTVKPFLRGHPREGQKTGDPLI